MISQAPIDRLRRAERAGAAAVKDDRVRPATAPLKTRYQARREAEALRPEAERLVGRLWIEKRGPDEVVAAIRADRMLSEKQRNAALRAVQRRSLLEQVGAKSMKSHEFAQVPLARLKNPVP
jgi:hypothetical protein